MCTNLKRIIRQGEYKETNYRGKKGEEYDIDIFAKCGYCEECQNEKANNWVIRNYYESQGHDKKCFITLTYAENTYFLIKKHLQDFMKRLRKKIDKNERKKIRCFYCGEYGTLYHRPHYHLIIYGWEDKKENIKYLGINKKNNLIFQSKIIQDTWGFGRTTYQEFERHEIPYITLYESAKETMSYEYKMSKKTVDELIKKLQDKEQNPIHRLIMLKECEKALKTMEKNKSDYYTVKEFNGWSKALGWDNFKKNYNKYKNYDFNEYIEDKQFITPSPWVKKLANSGDEHAIKEMLVRADELTTKGTLQETINYNKLNVSKKRKDDIMKHNQNNYIM